jgi:hypothetical protein
MNPDRGRLVELRKVLYNTSSLDIRGNPIVEMLVSLAARADIQLRKVFKTASLLDFRLYWAVKMLFLAA